MSSSSAKESTLLGKEETPERDLTGVSVLIRTKDYLLLRRDWLVSLLKICHIIFLSMGNHLMSFSLYVSIFIFAVCFHH